MITHDSSGPFLCCKVNPIILDQGYIYVSVCVCGGGFPEGGLGQLWQIENIWDFGQCNIPII